VALLWSQPATAKEKRTIDLPAVGSALTPGQQLQAAVNDAANTGVHIRLARGTYSLDPSRPNGGRLILQPGMDLSGENEYVDCDHDKVWDPIGACSGSSFDPDKFTVADSETLIDGTGITSAEPAPVGPTGVVRVGRDNVVARVTIRAPRIASVGGSLDVNVTPSVGEMSAVVSDSILEGGQRGVRCNNGAPRVSGIASSATIERNIIRRVSNAPGTLFGFGVQVQNGLTTGNSWNVTMRGNRIYASNIGVFIVGNASSAVDTDVLSMGNLIQRNGVGIVIAAGFNAGGAANDNHFRVNSQDDTIADNVTTAGNPAASFAGLGGGVVALGAARDGPSSFVCSANQLRLQLLQTRFIGNMQGASARHLTVIGSFASASAGPATGTGNQVRLLMRRTTSDGAGGAFVLDDSSPDDPTQTNIVTIIGSDVAFEHTNAGFDVPPAEFFLPWDE
jgi:hypothetical protein